MESGNAFIVIDGIDGGGKTTQTRLLVEYLEKRGFRVLHRIHPSSDSFFGIKTRCYLRKRGRAAHLGAALCYMFDVLRSTLIYGWRTGVVKVFTRYLMGTAYLPRSLYEAAYLFFASTLPTSNLMFVLDVTPAVARRRLEARGEDPEMFESLEELGEMRDRVLELAEKYGWTIVDADKPVSHVHKRIVDLLAEKQAMKPDPTPGS